VLRSGRDLAPLWSLPVLSNDIFAVRLGAGPHLGVIASLGSNGSAVGAYQDGIELWRVNAAGA